MSNNCVRQMSENGKGSNMRISTKKTRENFKRGYDAIRWSTKDDRQEKFINEENKDGKE